MKTVITDKPIVAREIARLLGASQKEEGYLTGNGYFVTWSIGHLVGLAMPEEYGTSGFQKASLPILPNPFLLTVRKVKIDNTYTDDADAQKQLKIIEQLINQSDSIIVATDAGREGELIFRYLYDYLKCNKPFERLWINSLTEKAIRNGFDNLKPGSDFEGLFQAALCRSRADWLIGINASQALSIAAGNGSYSLGRVQTPTLTLICKRYLENKNFPVQQYWQIQLFHTKEFIPFNSLSNNKWQNKKEADDALKSIVRNSHTAIVTNIEIKIVNEQPSLLFDLTGLQKEANKKLNLSAEETLHIAQNLYEKKFITNPRTGCEYIPNDMWAEIPNLIRVLQDRETFKQALSYVKKGYLNKRIVNELRVIDHHGLLITDKSPSALSPKENAIYNMIAFRLLESISQACTKEITEITLKVSHYDFTIKGCKILESGWRSIRGSFSNEENELQELPEITLDNELKINHTSVLEKKTNAPVLYTEASLLSAMGTAGKNIENQKECKALQSIGIGTPATRASIIEALFARNYIQRENKSLIPTSKGLQVYELVKDKKIADVTMSVQWEVAFHKIENNKADSQTFLKEMETYATSITQELLQTSIAKTNLPTLVCPKCKKQDLIIRDKIVKCPDEICNWVLFRNVCGVQISISDIESLLDTGKTSLIKGMQSKAGKKFNAYIVLNEKTESSFAFEKSKCIKK
jgi:DNA topoisomerase III